MRLHLQTLLGQLHADDGVAQVGVVFVLVLFYQPQSVLATGHIGEEVYAPEMLVPCRIIEVDGTATDGGKQFVGELVVIESLGFVANQPMNRERVGRHGHLLADDDHDGAVGEPHHIVQVGWAEDRVFEA